MPNNTRYVGRGTRWGNPFVVGEPHHLNHDQPIRDRKQAVELYELHTGPMGNYELDVDEVRRELGGLNLACWCPLPGPGETDWCHARVLLDIANEVPDA
jgi:hypothetical protein